MKLSIFTINIISAAFPGLVHASEAQRRFIGTYRYSTLVLVASIALTN